MKTPINSPIVEKLKTELCRLPGIGPRMAQRLAFHLMRRPKEEMRTLAGAINELADKVQWCKICGNLAEDETCYICRDTKRKQDTICVVEQPQDIAAIDRIDNYNGLFHVLGGALSPIDGIGPNELKIKSLLDRLRSGEVKEIVIATNPNTEGETTALYLQKLLKPLGVKTTRIARGLPIGGDLEYADPVTLAEAFSRRIEL